LEGSNGIFEETITVFTGESKENHEETKNIWKPS
jgi:hypothetical protein